MRETPVSRAEFERLKREVATLRAQVPVRVGFTEIPDYIQIIGGQTMATAGGITTYGGEKFAGTLASITTAAYDPGTVDPVTGEETAGPTPGRTAWPSGLCFGNARFRSGYKRVMVVNDSRGGASNALAGGDSGDTTYAPSARQTTISTERMLPVTLADGSTIRAWSPSVA